MFFTLLMIVVCLRPSSARADETLSAEFLIGQALKNSVHHRWQTLMCTASMTYHRGPRNDKHRQKLISQAKTQIKKEFPRELLGYQFEPEVKTFYAGILHYHQGDGVYLFGCDDKFVNIDRYTIAVDLKNSCQPTAAVPVHPELATAETPETLDHKEAESRYGPFPLAEGKFHCAPSKIGEIDKKTNKPMCKDACEPPTPYFDAVAWMNAKEEAGDLDDSRKRDFCRNCPPQRPTWSAKKGVCVDEDGCGETEVAYEMADGSIECGRDCGFWRYPGASGECFFDETKICGICDQIQRDTDSLLHYVDIPIEKLGDCTVEQVNQHIKSFAADLKSQLRTGVQACYDWVEARNQRISQATDDQFLQADYLVDQSPCLYLTTSRRLSHHLYYNLDCSPAEGFLEPFNQIPIRKEVFEASFR